LKSSPKTFVWHSCSRYCRA